ILDRYGGGRVACVSMMETYRARGAIREVAGAIGLPPHEIDQIAKAFPHIRARDIQAALRDLPELRRSGLGQEQLAGVFRLAERLDGLPRQIALHPCGVVLSDSTLPDRAPVERSFLGFPMTQYDKDDVEEMGLLKLDVIGVRMQSAISHTLAEIRRTEGVDIDIDATPRDDPATYDLIRTTHTLGCFQIESPGQRELVGKLQPETIGDIIVDISLFRPGPVNSDMVTPYLEARHGWQAPAYPHPDLVPALAETGGVVVFHEQVLRIIARMTGCPMSRAEEARRALDDPVGCGEVRAWFQVEASGRGYAPETVERVWRVLASFGAFGFCKAHAAAFAVPTYQSAWLKTHHTAAFFAGVLTHEPGMYPTRALLDDARHFGVAVLPLDVNVSDECWRVERAGDARWGVRVPLSAVKGISDDEVHRVVANRPYRSLPDFWYRAGVSRPVVERVVEVGGFDALYVPRERPPRSRAVRRRRTRRPGGVARRDLLVQISALERAGHGALRGQLPIGVEEEPAPSGLPEMTGRDRVRAELDVLGFEVDRHVISFYDDLLDALGVVRARDLLRCRSGADVLVAGVKIATQTPPVRSGQRVIFATLDDATGLSDVTFFQSVQEACAATVFGAWLLVVRGRMRRTGARGVSLRATHCWDLTVLHRMWRSDGPATVWEAMRSETGDEEGRLAGGGSGSPRAAVYEEPSRTADSSAVPARAPVSPYSDVTPAGGPPGLPPRKLWHASPGSPGR
ncbi:MAG: DNA polymerase III subunit alpha, partial [Streptosporangiaceae bacterium]